MAKHNKPRRNAPKHTQRVQIGWVVKARVPMKRKQWFEKEREFRMIEVFTTKVISPNFVSTDAANTFLAIARRDERYVSAWVTENYGEEEVMPGGQS
jgi:hypothetical protein